MASTASTRTVHRMANGEIHVYTPRTGSFSKYRATLAFGKRPTWRHVGGPDVGPIELERLGITTATAREELGRGAR